MMAERCSVETGDTCTPRHDLHPSGIMKDHGNSQSLLFGGKLALVTGSASGLGAAIALVGAYVCTNRCNRNPVYQDRSRVSPVLHHNSHRERVQNSHYFSSNCRLTMLLTDPPDFRAQCFSIFYASRALHRRRFAFALSRTPKTDRGPL